MDRSRNRNNSAPIKWEPVLGVLLERAGNQIEISRADAERVERCRIEVRYELEREVFVVEAHHR